MSQVTFESTDGEVLPLCEVIDSWRIGLPLDLRPMASGTLHHAPRPVDDQLAVQLVEMATGYPSFEPPLAPDVRNDVLIEALAATQGDRLGLEIALAVEGLGLVALASLIERLGKSTDDAIGADRVEVLLSYLLDDVGSRETVVLAIGGWPDGTTATERRERVAPYLDDEERTRAAIKEEGPHDRYPRDL